MFAIRLRIRQSVPVSGGASESVFPKVEAWLEQDDHENALRVMDKLDELAPCRCCCAEHTFHDCPARAWNGCRGQYSFTFADEESWRRHYETHHGMSYDEFYGLTS